MASLQTLPYLRVALKQKLHAKEDINELCKFTGKPKAEVERLFWDKTLSQDKWTKINPQTEAEILRFYAETETPMYTNLLWYVTDIAKYKSQSELLKFCQTNNVKSVLDYGGGAGEYCIHLAKQGLNVAYCDVYGHTWKFSQWRFQRRNLKVQMLRAGQDPLGTHDVIICTDVLEHVKSPVNVLANLHGALCGGGFLVATFPFDVRKPQHLEENVKYAQTIRTTLKEMGFKAIGKGYFEYFQKTSK